MKKIMVDYEAFLKGIKPAIYCNLKSKAYRDRLPLFQHYPSITENIELFDTDDQFFLFFQTGKLKQQFIQATQQLSTQSSAFHHALGVILGYPPKAVDFYTKTLGDSHAFYDSISIGYAGIRCISHVDDLLENLQWLWSQYQVNEETRVMIDSDFYYVKFNEIEEARSIQQIQRNSRTIYT